MLSEQSVAPLCALTHVCEHLFVEHGATEADKTLLRETENRALECIWSRLSLSLRKSLCTLRFGGQYDGQDSPNFASHIDVAMSKLALFQKLDTTTKNTLMDIYFPDVRSRPPQFTYNLHLDRNLHGPTTHVITSMSPNNWSQWHALLDSLYSQDQIALKAQKQPLPSEDILCGEL